MPQVIVKINKHTAKMVAEANGFVGKSCEQAMDFIKRISNNATVEHKPEFDAVEEINVETGR